LSHGGRDCDLNRFRFLATPAMPIRDPGYQVTVSTRQESMSSPASTSAPVGAEPIEC